MSTISLFHIEKQETGNFKGINITKCPAAKTILLNIMKYIV